MCPPYLLFFFSFRFSKNRVLGGTATPSSWRLLSASWPKPSTWLPKSWTARLTGSCRPRVEAATRTCTSRWAPRRTALTTCQKSAFSRAKAFSWAYRTRTDLAANRTITARVGYGTVSTSETLDYSILNVKFLHWMDSSFSHPSCSVSAWGVQPKSWDCLRISISFPVPSRTLTLRGGPPCLYIYGLDLLFNMWLSERKDGKEGLLPLRDILCLEFHFICFSLFYYFVSFGWIL